MGHLYVGFEDQPGKEFAGGHTASNHGERGFGCLSSELQGKLLNLSSLSFLVWKMEVIKATL